MPQCVHYSQLARTTGKALCSNMPSYIIRFHCIATSSFSALSLVPYECLGACNRSHTKAQFFMHVYLILLMTKHFKSNSAAEGPAERYCERLETQNSGELTVALIVYIGQATIVILVLFGLCFCTAGCTSCCCCARENWCYNYSTACSEGCYACWGGCLLRCGCGWCVVFSFWRMSLLASLPL